MKIYRSGLFILTALSLMCSSCEKVVQLDLSESSPQIVIEGVIYDQPGPYEVKISKSVGINEGTDIYQTITGASVVISDNVGNSDTLKESSSGSYITSTIEGVPGRTYFLKVITGGITYTASSTMPYPVGIGSMYFEKGIWGNDIQLEVKYQDPADTINYYRMVEFINSELQERFDVISDKLNEGEEISYSFMAQENDKKFESGDIVTIWLESIDKSVYEYFREAGSDDGESASPANPTSNFNNDALGYFNACTVSKKSITVP
jgi:hypothetical protein